MLLLDYSTTTATTIAVVKVKPMLYSNMAYPSTNSDAIAVQISSRSLYSYSIP